MFQDHRHHGLFVILGRGFADTGDTRIRVHFNKDPVSRRRMPAWTGDTHQVRGDVLDFHTDFPDFTS